MTTFNPSNRGNYVGSQNAPLPQLQLQALRAANIAAFNAGPIIPAPLWTTGATVTAGNAVTLTGGQHIYSTVGGTTGASMPVYSGTVLTGRPLNDNGVIWYGWPFVKSTTDVNAPTITSGANAAAVGLTETRFVSGASTVLPAIIPGLFGANGANHLSGTYLARYGFANAPAAGSGNVTSIAVTDAGLSNLFTYQVNSCDTEFYITDAKFGLTFNSTNPIVVEIDGQLVQGNPTPGTGVGWCIAYDFNGIVKRRRVKVTNNSLIDQLRGYATTAIGFIEPTDSPNDTLLLLGDSINTTVIPTAVNGLGGPMGWWISKLLGMTSVINAGIGGSGYATAGANSFTTLQCVTATPNLSLFPAYNPGHVLISSGYNDRNTPFTTVGPAALATWNAVRTILPNAKITITDGFSEATGPDAASLAQAANLAALFNTWGDGNSIFVKSIGTASTAWMQGTNNAGGALQLGNTCNYVSTDATHPTPAGSYYLATRVAAAMKTQWNNAY